MRLHDPDPGPPDPATPPLPVAPPTFPPPEFLRSMPFTRLLDQRIVFLKGAIENHSADDLVAQLLALDAESDDDITLYIDSPGGDMSGLFALYDTMQMLRSRVHTKCVGLAASAAAVILAGGTGTRSATPNARILIHQPLGRVGGTETDIRIHVKEWVFLRQRMEEILAERTGQAVDKIHADTDRDYWMSAIEAKEYGLIDEVVTGPPFPRLHQVVGDDLMGDP